MTRIERIVFWTVIAFAIVLILYFVLPPVGLAVLALGLVFYGLCCLFERAFRRAWRR